MEDGIRMGDPSASQLTSLYLPATPPPTRPAGTTPATGLNIEQQPGVESSVVPPPSFSPVSHTANLAHHIWKAYEKIVPESSRSYRSVDEIFHATRKFPYLMRGDHVNRILLYPGSFNPPHIGHYEHLQHIFYKAQHLLNVVAAIVLPRDDRFVAKKFRDQPETTIFSRAERVQLWKMHEPLLPWKWAFDGGEDAWDEFEAALRESCVKQGYQIEFVCVIGPDYATVRDGPTRKPWGDGSSITSDVCRKADFVGERGKLSTLKACDPWEEHRLDRMALRSHARHTATILTGTITRRISEAIETKLQEGEDEISVTMKFLIQQWSKQPNTIKKCRQTDRPNRMVYFVPRNIRAKEYSSTELRAVINLHIGHKEDITLRNKLEGFALSPMELAKILKSKIAVS